MSKVLCVENLATHFYLNKKVYRAVDGVSFSISPGQSIALVGESGCGKSVSALSLMQLLPPTAKIVNGSVFFEGRNLLESSENEFQSTIRGQKMSMIFQEPHSALNPVLKLKTQMIEHLKIHLEISEAEALDRVYPLLKLAGLRNRKQLLEKYPHQLSGGQIQRLMIAMALLCNPSLVIADEPTTALDVTVQRQIIDLVRDLKSQLSTSFLLITHNLALVNYLVDYIYIMYAGQVVEEGACKDIFRNPLHPYTRGLLDSILSVDREYATDQKIHGIPGIVPESCDFPRGCRFAPRCSRAMAKCSKETPEWIYCDDQKVRCFLYE